MHSRPIAIAVDLTPLQVGGGNGGLKPATLSLLKAVGELDDYAVVFIYLTSGSSHHEIRDIARPGDLVLCVNGTEHFVPDPDSGISEYRLSRPPADLIRRCGADVLYCPFGDASFHVPGVPTVITIVDLLFKDWPFTLAPAEIAHREQYVTRSLSLAARVQCISRSTIRQIRRHYPDHARKLFLLYLPVHGRLPQASDPDPADMNRPYFFYPANFWRHKNHEILLMAYQIYRRKAGDAAWDLVLTGHPDSRSDAMKHLAVTLGISDGVHFPGYVSETVLSGLYAHAGALVFPSLHEGFGIPLVESMSYGLPIIAGRTYSIPEVCGDACHYVDPRKPVDLADAMLKIATDPAYAADLGRKSRNRLQLFHLRSEAGKLGCELYHAAFSDQKRFSPLFPENETDRMVLPTPSGTRRWKLDIGIREGCEARLSVFIGENPFGSFSAADYPGGISLFCYPDGKALTLVLWEAEGGENVPIESLLDRIICSNRDGESIVLFGGL